MTRDGRIKVRKLVERTQEDALQRRRRDDVAHVLRALERDDAGEPDAQVREVFEQRQRHRFRAREAVHVHPRVSREVRPHQLERVRLRVFAHTKRRRGGVERRQSESRGVAARRDRKRRGKLRPRDRRKRERASASLVCTMIGASNSAAISICATKTRFCVSLAPASVS
eukprot:13798-Pelagococcus_subviridis.AAC.2